MNKFKKGNKIHCKDVKERKFTGTVLGFEDGHYIMSWSDVGGKTPYLKNYVEDDYCLARKANVFGGKSKVVLEDKNNG